MEMKESRRKKEGEKCETTKGKVLYAERKKIDPVLPCRESFSLVYFIRIVFLFFEKLKKPYGMKKKSAYIINCIIRCTCISFFLRYYYILMYVLCNCTADANAEAKF